jgi:hypothetical protein
MNTLWYAHLGWIVAAGVLGPAITLTFSAWLHLSRKVFLFPYIGITSLFLYAYARWSGFSITELLLHNWVWGLAGAVLLALFTVKNILSQPVSLRAKGASLLLDLLWSGVAYGLTDALLLSVLPVFATWQAFTLLNWTTTLPGKILVGVIAMSASVLVTVTYHFGYREYRGNGMRGPVIGNTAMTIGYLLTNNPLAAILSHIAMHIAGVLRGPASVMQLPPHY